MYVAAPPAAVSLRNAVSKTFWVSIVSGLSSSCRPAAVTLAVPLLLRFALSIVPFFLTWCACSQAAVSFDCSDGSNGCSS